MCYQGPEYGGTELDEAKKLIQTTLHLYPNRPDRALMEADLQRIELAKAAQLWANVKFWKVKANPKAVAICCKEVIQKFPNSDYARMAREELATIKPEDKRDIPHPKYEDKVARSADGAPPNAFDEPGSQPKHVPVQRQRRPVPRGCKGSRTRRVASGKRRDTTSNCLAAPLSSPVTLFLAAALFATLSGQRMRLHGGNAHSNTTCRRSTCRSPRLGGFSPRPGVPAHRGRAEADPAAHPVSTRQG